MVLADPHVLVHVEDDHVAPRHVRGRPRPARRRSRAASCPVANMAWATPDLATDARRIAAAASAATRAIDAVSGSDQHLARALLPASERAIGAL